MEREQPALMVVLVGAQHRPLSAVLRVELLAGAIDDRPIVGEQETLNNIERYERTKAWLLVPPRSNEQGIEVALSDGLALEQGIGHSPKLGSVLVQDQTGLLDHLEKNQLHPLREVAAGQMRLGQSDEVDA